MSDSGDINIKFTLQLPQPASIFAITHDGIQPLSLVRQYPHLIDRSILAKLSSTHKSPSDEYWISQLNDSEIIINPLFCAMEGCTRSTPTLNDFIAQYVSARKLIEKYLPCASVTPHTDESLKGSYAIVTDLAERNIRESMFLLAVTPLLSQKVPKVELQLSEQKIISIAHECGLYGSSLPLIAVLSCLYEDSNEKHVSPGRGILKPKKNYTIHDAHNSLSDLRVLEMLIAFTSFGYGQVAFITRDKSLGRFWKILETRSTPSFNRRATGIFKITKKLMPRIDDDGFQRLEVLFNGKAMV